MQPIQAIYKFGNLYDKNTKKRILIEDGSEISVTIQPQHLLSQDPNLKPEKLLNATEKEAEVNAKIGKEKHWKLFNSGEKLYFEISAGIKKSTTKNEGFRGVFQVKLLEDLYIFNKKSDVKYARFFKCHCLVESCLNGFEYFEPIYTTSLNDTYTKTYELYFSMFGKSTCNAFNEFSQYENMKVKIRGVTESIQKR